MKHASAGTAHHCATQCKDATDGHHNYISRFGCFLFSRSASGNTMVKKVVQLRDDKIAARCDRQGCRQGGDRGDLPSIVSLCFLILAFWLLTTKNESSGLAE